MSRALLCSLMLAVVPLSGAEGSELTPGEIAGELVGRQIAWWEAAGWRHGYLMLLPDGVAEMTVDHPDSRHDSGRWTLRGDEVCTRWGEVRGGLEKCYRISRGGDGLFLTTGGNVFEVRELGV